MLDDDLIKRLANRLTLPLPGRSVQEPLAPPHCLGKHFETPPADVRQAAVMILLYRHQGEWHIPLTVRAAHLKDHAGQISLPGGRIEPDESPEQAAVREIHEELSISDRNLQLIGRLSSIYLYVSHFFVTPVLGSYEHLSLIHI